MLINLLLCALLVYQLFVFWRLREVRRHDHVLFRFCEIRRRTVAFIYTRDRSGEMGREEYRSARFLLLVLNGIVADYDQRRAGMFNFRELRQRLRDYEKTSGALNPVTPPANLELGALYRETARALVLAFFAYTPFLRSEFMLFLMLRLGAACFKESAINFSRPLRDAERFGVKVGGFGGAATV